MIVLDASAAVEWLLGRSAAATIAARMTDPDCAVHAQSTLNVEVASAMRGLVRGGHASAERGLAAITDLAASDIVLHDPVPLLPRAWQLRHNLTMYDALYVALAELLDAALVTTDARIARASGIRAKVEVATPPVRS